MKSIAKLKDKARKHEQKEDWKSAIDVYRQVLKTQEADDAVELELGLYNRVGDLFLRIGQIDNAVDYYEQAADRYAESGFFNNAIALCNKVLRHRPHRIEVYLKLSRFSHEQGFHTDARRWILSYAEKQVKAGNAEAAMEGLQEFATTSDAPDVRELLAQHLASHSREGEAVEQLRLAHAEWARRGDQEAAARAAEQARALDPDVALDADAAGPVPSVQGLPGLDEPEPDELELETPVYQAADAEDEPPAMGDAVVEGLESHAAQDVDTADQALGDLETFEGAPAAPDTEDTAADEEEAEPLPLLDTEEDDADAQTDGDVEPDLDSEAHAPEEPAEEPLAAVSHEEPEPEEAVAGEPEPDEPEPDEPVTGEPEPEPDVAEAEEAVAEAPPRDASDARDEMAPLEGLDLGLAGLDQQATPAEERDPVADAFERAARAGIEPVDLDMSTLSLGIAGEDEPEPAEGSAEDLDVHAVLGRARELVSRGLLKEAARELRLFSGTHADASVFRQALVITNEIVRHDPDDIQVLQRRVEFASRTGDTKLMVGTYLDLAQALTRTGSETKARAMYQRVRDLDPANPVARKVLGPAPRQAEEDFDLSGILEEVGPAEGSSGAEGEGDKEGGEPADEELADLLTQLRSMATDQAGGEDAGDHYDLGLAFKEMGLIDEAIAEFQTALTGGEERLKVYEELGQCFILKGQHTVAVKILKRALKAPHQDPTDLLGVYYQLGQCYEALGDRAEARAAYEKVLDINPRFGDVPERVGRL